MNASPSEETYTSLSHDYGNPHNVVPVVAAPRESVAFLGAWASSLARAASVLVGQGHTHPFGI
ncbi:hypothetical protein PGT21_014674 [Puccinia graminis f. sp. tritici]|uniref:Uncharacterized protein n=1 Tax=Puccinia graminis f. sp. tritici TaxID=56615 RepID=A0A5B0QF80_PUCGR|nr:hypothetical protein PGT21_014674 [Puccinia graminis f. sp. tritici]